MDRCQVLRTYTRVRVLADLVAPSSPCQPCLYPGLGPGRAVGFYQVGPLPAKRPLRGLHLSPTLSRRTHYASTDTAPVLSPLQLWPHNTALLGSPQSRTHLIHPRVPEPSMGPAQRSSFPTKDVLNKRMNK